MVHLLRWRELLTAASELTEIDIPEKRKEQLASILDRAEKLAEEIEKTWGKSVIAMAIVFNIRDWVAKVRATRFVS